MRLGFTDPIWVQYGRFAKGIVVGSEYDTGVTVEQCPAPCLGYSFITQNPVLPDLLDRLPVTLSLAAGAAVLWLFGGVATGVVSALKRGSLLDRTAMGIALAGVSLPIFFTGLLALSIFSYGLGWTAQGGSYTPFQENPAQWAYDLLLPWITLSFLYAAAYARLTRAGMLETMNEDYIRTARAKGLKERNVVVRHGSARRADADPDDLRSRPRPAARRRDPHRVDLLAQRDRQVRRRRRGQQRPPQGARRDLARRDFIVIANLVVDLLYAVVDPRVRVS